MSISPRRKHFSPPLLMERGFESPGRGFESPGRAFESPGRGFESPGRGFESPGRGFESPGRWFESLACDCSANSKPLEAASLEADCQQWSRPQQNFSRDSKLAIFFQQGLLQDVEVILPRSWPCLRGASAGKLLTKVPAMIWVSKPMMIISWRPRPPFPPITLQKIWFWVGLALGEG